MFSIEQEYFYFSHCQRIISETHTTTKFFMRSICLSLLFMLLPACSTTDSRDNAGAPAGIDVSKHTGAAEPSFGDPYEIATMGENVTAPALNDGILTLWVSYSGGCAEHGFQLGISEEADKIALWFTHDANSDFCEAYLTSQIALDLTQEIANDKSIELLNPNGDPYPLR